MAYDDKDVGDGAHVETIERRKSTSEEVAELSGIEDTAASTAAWLISITVSIGGFLFGKYRVGGKNVCYSCNSWAGFGPVLTGANRLRHGLHLVRPRHDRNVSRP